MLRNIIVRMTSRSMGLLQTNLQISSSSRSFRVTTVTRDLMEFFDNKKNWGEQEVKVGRAWNVDELRIKSNTDLHKLWFVLLKEKNMLLTMEAECKRECHVFPNPERIDKVEESMKHIETVVKERNRAYFLLETGETGERPGGEEENFLGLKEYKQYEEYPIPKEQNKEWLLAKEAEPQSSPEEKKWFLVRWNAKMRKIARSKLGAKKYEVINILQTFPNVDVLALKAKYPEVNVDKYVKQMKEKNYENRFTSEMPYASLYAMNWRK